MAPLKLDRQIFFTMKLDREDGEPPVHIHAAPISLETFDENVILLGQTFTQVYQGGIGQAAGPRVAASVLRRIAKGLGGEQGLQGVEEGLMAEIHRLTHVMVSNVSNGDPLPWDVAVNEHLLDETEIHEVENALVFFSLAWRMHNKRERSIMVIGGLSLWGASVSSSNIMAFAASLRTLTAGGNTTSTPKSESPSPEGERSIASVPH